MSTSDVLRPRGGWGREGGDPQWDYFPPCTTHAPERWPDLRHLPLTNT